MYKLTQTTKFKKDLKKILKASTNDFNLTFDVLELLKNQGVLGIPAEMKPHQLKGNYKNNWECHIKSDLLIIWIQIKDPKEISLVRIGTHSELFK